MTAAVVALAVAVVVLTACTATAGGLYVALAKSLYELKAQQMAIVVDHRGVVAQSIEKSTRIATLERVLAAAQADRDKYRAQAVAGLSSDELDRIINGVPDPVREGGSPDRDPAPTSDGVPTEGAARGSVTWTIGDL